MGCRREGGRRTGVGFMGGWLVGGLLSAVFEVGFGADWG